MSTVRQWLNEDPANIIELSAVSPDGLSRVTWGFSLLEFGQLEVIRIRTVTRGSTKHRWRKAASHQWSRWGSTVGGYVTPPDHLVEQALEWARGRVRFERPAATEGDS